MENSKIEWTDCTFNPWIGCEKISEGCANCYAWQRDVRFASGVHWGKGADRERTSAGNWAKPMRWNRLAGQRLFVECSACGKREFRKWDDSLPPGGLSCCSNAECLALPETESFTARPRVFCASLADWLDEEVPIEWLADLLDLIRQTPNLDWLMLTKRPENFEERLLMAGMAMLEYPETLATVPEMTIESVLSWSELTSYPSNVWIGTTAENQQRADERISHLLKIPARVRFLSCEPLLGPIDIQGALDKMPWQIRSSYDAEIHWVIAGGESGPGARPMHPDWARSLREQCRQAGVPFLFKQWGEFSADGERLGKHASGRVLDGETLTAFPELAHA